MKFASYDSWEQYKAFQEYVSANRISYKYLAYTERGTQVCVQVL